MFFSHYHVVIAILKSQPNSFGVPSAHSVRSGILPREYIATISRWLLSPSIDCGAFELGSTRSEGEEGKQAWRERKEGARRERRRVHVLGCLVLSPWRWGWWWSESGLGIIFYFLDSGRRDNNILHTGTIYNSYSGSSIYFYFRATLTRKLELE